MKLKAIAAAVTVVAAAPAFALDPLAWGGPDIPAERILNVSGATASSDSIELFATAEFCDGTQPISVFHDDDSGAGDDGTSTTIDVSSAPSAGSNEDVWTIICTASSGTGASIAGQPIIVRKANLGSGFGAAPVCDAGGQSVEYINIAGVGPNPGSTYVNDAEVEGVSDGTSNCALKETLTAPGGGTISRYGCETESSIWGETGTESGTFSIKPDVGISDVGPDEIFQGSLATTDCDNVVPFAALPFTVVVTNGLYEALQEAQGLTVGDLSEANMPSVNRNILAAIFSGRLNRWSEITFDGVPLTSFGGGPTSTFVDPDLITICRRADSSGTHASIAIKVLQQNAFVGPDPFVTQRFNGSTQSTVIRTSGSSDQGACMNMLSETGPGSAAYDVGFIGLPGATDEFGNWGISYQSATKDTFVDDGKTGYKRVKIDGFSPSAQNVAAGNYYVWTYSTINYDNLGSAQVAIIDDLFLASNSAPQLAQLLEEDHYGTSGFIATSDQGCTNTTTFDLAAPCMPWTLRTGPSSVNNFTQPKYNNGDGIDFQP